MAEEPLNGRFTQREFEVASWWVRHGLQVRRTGYGALIVLSVIVWGYALWGLLDAYAISYPRESRITRQIALNQQLLAGLQTDTPQNVSLGDVNVAQTTGGRFDMSVEAQNPNAQWWAEFNYHFNLSGEDTPNRSGYILPGSTQIVSELGYTPKSAGGSSATLVVENVRWHRVDPALVGASYKDFAASHFNMTATDVTYDTDITLGAQKVGQTSFHLVNNSAYGFWNVEVVVRLYRGASPVAVNAITVTNLQPGESRPIKMVWTDNLPGITKTEVIPQVNILDKSSYLPTTYFK